MGHEYCEALRVKFQFYEAFWKGKASYPILFAKPHLAKGKAYKKYNLMEQHQSAEKHLEERLLEVEHHLDLIDDGIPTIRSDLGTTLLPSGLGLKIKVQEELHPWLMEHLTPEQYLSLPDPVKNEDILHNEVYFSKHIYELFYDWKKQGKIPETVIPYVPETEGVFDLSQLILGTGLFLLLMDQPQLAHRIQQKSLQVYLAGTSFFKGLLGQPACSMVHGHGMPVGAWFPDTGARISEDSCVLISGPMLREFCLPYIKEAARPFGRLFMHYCGYHMDFLRMVCDMREISTINLGNPELYDLEEVFALCGKTDTVYFGHLPRCNGEDSWSFLERIATSCRRNKARVILVCDFLPESPEEKMRLVRLWHHLTSGK
ncbi:MAG: hypothetical protein ACUVWJ_03785 [Spirochaetota bacterium]